MCECEKEFRRTRRVIWLAYMGLIIVISIHTTAIIGDQIKEILKILKMVTK